MFDDEDTTDAGGGSTSAPSAHRVVVRRVAPGACLLECSTAVAGAAAGWEMFCAGMFACPPGDRFHFVFASAEEVVEVLHAQYPPGSGLSVEIESDDGSERAGEDRGVHCS